MARKPTAKKAATRPTRKAAAKRTATKPKAASKAASKAAPKAASKAASKAAPKAASKVASRKAAAPKRLPVIKERLHKAGIVQSLADSTQLSKKQILDVLNGLENLIERSVRNHKDATGEFNLLGLLKIERYIVPARKKRTGRNPSSGEPITIAAKRAHPSAKVKALKRLKQMAGDKR